MMRNVHVGIQVRREPAQLIRADAAQARWTFDIEIIHSDGLIDFRGPAVHGTRGERFVYLTWGDVGDADEFEMFRRAKLMLNRIEPEILESATRTETLACTVELTDAQGGPRCARVDPSALTWSDHDH